MIRFLHRQRKKKKLQNRIRELDIFHVFQPVIGGIRSPTSLMTRQLVSLDFLPENISETRQTALYKSCHRRLFEK